MLENLVGTWWAWVVLGFALGVLEILAPGYIFLGFAIGAVLTGILVGVGLAPAGLPALLVIFAVASLAAWLVLRRTMGIRQGQVKIWDRDINDNP
jgi:membrane protein implicated in regulation of membrane protease activity